MSKFKKSVRIIYLNYFVNCKPFKELLFVVCFYVKTYLKVSI